MIRIFLIFVPVLPIALFWYHIYRKSKNTTTEYLVLPSKPFSVSEYFGRMEQAQLDILEDQRPVDQVVILWWGLDGLTLDENGELKWISRKKPEPVNQNVFYQPCQSILYADNEICKMANMCQSTQSKIDTLRMQNIFSQINTCCAQAKTQNYPYYLLY